ncbi:MAG: DUF4367 domain-containing protein [Caldicoprobacterales bacterium]|nr:DUF4367 domain-containing protein [Clostridiales bacterium]
MKKFLIGYLITGDNILFEQCRGQSNLRIDTENAETTKIKINGKGAIVVSKEGMTHLIWHNNKRVFTLSGILDEKELIKMAESVTKY